MIHGMGTYSVGCTTGDMEHLLTSMGIPSSWFGSGLAGCVVPSTKGSWVWELVDEFGESRGSTSYCLHAGRALSMLEPAEFALLRCLCASCSRLRLQEGGRKGSAL